MRIDRSHPLYPGECRLRERVLLNSVGYDIDSFQKAYPGFEERFEHFVAVAERPSGDPEVIGCALLLPNEPHVGSGKLMQMAVDPQRQGEGIGRQLVVAVEGRAFGDLGLVELFCHAQASAVAFYDRLGWTVLGDRFNEAGLEHAKMVIAADTQAIT
ncbi:MAG: GNAT family N-acetyltransferase [Planctomycetota bacterium]